MKNIFKYTLVVLAMLFIASCEDEDTQRIPLDELGNGPNARFRLDPNFTNLDFADIQNAKVAWDFFSQSKDLDRVVLSMVFNPVTGTPSDTIEVITYTQEQINAGGGIIPNQEFTANALAQLAGLTGAGDLNGGDNFTFINTTYMADGRVYPNATPNNNTNVTPNIANSALTTSWTAGWVSYVACPITAAFAATYDSSPDVCYAGNFTGPVTLTPLGGPVFQMAGFSIYGFTGRQINIVLVCGQVIIPEQSPGLGCGANALNMRTAASGAGTYTEDDDSTLTLRIDYPSTCGGIATDCEIVLTKQ